MPLFSRTDASNGPVEYTAVAHGNADDHIDDLRQNNDGERDPSSSRRNSVISDRSPNADKNAGAAHTAPAPRETPDEERTDSDNIPVIIGWPKAPRPLSGFSIPVLIGDILLILLPIAFLVLAISAWRLDGKELSENGATVKRAMNLGPTIYPLAFAAIGGRCLRSIAIRLAERGTTISLLERLLGSQSLVSALGTAISLRSANFVTLGLLLVWTLSPLGGQSSLRLLHQANSTIAEPGTVYYSDPAAPLALSQSSSWFTVIPAILSASLASSFEAKGRPVDLWTHPKIPRLDALEQEALHNPNTTGEWIDVDRSSNLTYSSFAGVNVQGLRAGNQSDFQIKYNYLRLGCEKYIGGTDKEVLSSLVNSTTQSFYPPFERQSSTGIAANRLTNTSVIIGSDMHYVTISFFLRSAYGMPEEDDHRGVTGGPSDEGQLKGQPMKFLYGSQFNIRTRPARFQVYECTPHLVTVDAQMACASDACEVVRLRRVPGDTIEGQAGACDDDRAQRLVCLTTATLALRTFYRFFTTAVGAWFSAGTLSPFDDWIAGSNETYPVNATDYDRDLSRISDEMISDRLTTVVNTYIQAGSWGSQITRAGLFDVPKYNASIAAPDQRINTTDTIFTYQVPVYKADIGWIIILLLATIVLLFLGVVNVAVSLTTIAPDLFYYASSLARENPYTNTPDGGTALDGAERSRLLRKMRVQVADVSPENEVGYVVVKSVEPGEDFATGRLRKGRLYW